MNFITKKNKKWWILVAMTGSLSMIFLDGTVVGVCLPTIQYQLGMTNTGLEWVMNAYVLAVATLVAAGGSLGDIVGRKKTFITGMTLFALSSALCGIAPNGIFLVLSRGLQGIGGALMVPASAAIVNTSFELHERGKAMSIYVGISTVFMALGPLIGGFLSQYFSWRWCFYINLPVATVSIILTFLSSPKEYIVCGQKFDFAGGVTFVIASVCTVLGLQEANNFGWDSPLTIGLIIVGIITFFIFVKIEKRKKFPLIDMNLFKYDNFGVDFLVLFFLQLAIIGQAFFNVIYIQNVLGFSPLNAGFISMFTIIPLALIVHVSGRMFDKMGVKIPVTIGLGMVLLSYAMAPMVLCFQNVYLIIPYMILLGLGAGFAIGPAQIDALNRIPKTLRGQAAGLTQTSRQMGATVGLALLSTVFNYTDKIKINDIMSSLFINHKDYYVIMKTLSTPEKLRVTLLHHIISDDKIAVLVVKLKSAMSISIALAYALAAVSAAAALVIAIKKLTKGVQLSD